MKGWFAGALVLSIAFAVSGIRGRAASNDPYQIFSSARNVWAQQRYPQYLTYTVTVTVNEGGVRKTKHYHLAYDSDTAKIYVNPVSDEERVAPPDGTGITFHLLPRRQGKVLFDKKVGRPPEAVDYLGVPLLSPTYSFGMAVSGSESAPDPDALVQQIRTQFRDPIPAAKARELAQSGAVHTIAAVTSYRRQYDVSLDGVETVDGRPCYHLMLRPGAASARLRLRELWVDTENYETRQLVTASNFTGSSVPWIVRFANDGGALYIASETSMGGLGVGRHHYEGASIVFESIARSNQPPSALTSWFVTKENIMSEPSSGGGRL